MRTRYSGADIHNEFLGGFVSSRSETVYTYDQPSFE